MVRLLARILGVCVTIAVVLGCILAAWFFLYSADLPDISGLRRYAPKQATLMSVPCSRGESTAIPYDAIGYNLRAALTSAEANVRPDQAGLSMQIARMTYCEPSRMLERDLKEARIAAQVNLRYSRDELLTIYANRVWFGDNQVGVEAASQYYFGKEPNQLDIGEAALLAGLVKAPSVYSPYKNPDRALLRRNEVIDAMAQDHVITDDQGKAAKATSLGVAMR